MSQFDQVSPRSEYSDDSVKSRARLDNHDFNSNNSHNSHVSNNSSFEDDDVINMEINGGLSPLPLDEYSKISDSESKIFHNTPEPIQDFIGQQHEEILDSIYNDITMDNMNPFIVLLGCEGIGKSCVASTICNDLIGENNRLFCDGIIYLDLMKWHKMYQYKTFEDCLINGIQESGLNTYWIQKYDDFLQITHSNIFDKLQQYLANSLIVFEDFDRFKEVNNISLEECNKFLFNLFENISIKTKIIITSRKKLPIYYNFNAFCTKFYQLSAFNEADTLDYLLSYCPVFEKQDIIPYLNDIRDLTSYKPIFIYSLYKLWQTVRCFESTFDSIITLYKQLDKPQLLIKYNPYNDKNNINKIISTKSNITKSIKKKTTTTTSSSQPTSRQSSNNKLTPFWNSSSNLEQQHSSSLIKQSSISSYSSSSANDPLPDTPPEPESNHNNNNKKGDKHNEGIPPHYSPHYIHTNNININHTKQPLFAYTNLYSYTPHSPSLGAESYHSPLSTMNGIVEHSWSRQQSISFIYPEQQQQHNYNNTLSPDTKQIKDAPRRRSDIQQFYRKKKGGKGKKTNNVQFDAKRRRSDQIQQFYKMTKTIIPKQRYSFADRYTYDNNTDDTAFSINPYHFANNTRIRIPNEEKIHNHYHHNNDDHHSSHFVLSPLSPLIPIHSDNDDIPSNDLRIKRHHSDCGHIESDDNVIKSKSNKYKKSGSKFKYKLRKKFGQKKHNSLMRNSFTTHEVTKKEKRKKKSIKKQYKNHNHNNNMNMPRKLPPNISISKSAESIQVEFDSNDNKIPTPIVGRLNANNLKTHLNILSLHDLNLNESGTNESDMDIDKLLAMDDDNKYQDNNNNNNNHNNHDIEYDEEEEKSTKHNEWVTIPETYDGFLSALGAEIQRQQKREEMENGRFIKTTITKKKKKLNQKSHSMANSFKIYEDAIQESYSDYDDDDDDVDDDDDDDDDNKSISMQIRINDVDILHIDSGGRTDSFSRKSQPIMASTGYLNVFDFPATPPLSSCGGILSEGSEYNINDDMMDDNISVNSETMRQNKLMSINLIKNDDDDSNNNNNNNYYHYNKSKKPQKKKTKNNKKKKKKSTTKQIINKQQQQQHVMNGMSNNNSDNSDNNNNDNDNTLKIGNIYFNKFLRMTLLLNICIDECSKTWLINGMARSLRTQDIRFSVHKNEEIANKYSYISLLCRCDEYDIKQLKNTFEFTFINNELEKCISESLGKPKLKIICASCVSYRHYQYLYSKQFLRWIAKSLPNAMDVIDDDNNDEYEGNHKSQIEENKQLEVYHHPNNILNSINARNERHSKYKLKGNNNVKRKKYTYSSMNKMSIINADYIQLPFAQKDVLSRDTMNKDKKQLFDETFGVGYYNNNNNNNYNHDNNSLLTPPNMTVLHFMSVVL